MEKVFKWGSVTLAGVLLTLGVVGTLVVPVMATEEKEVQPRAAEMASDEKPAEVPPTFVTDVNDRTESAGIWAGRNYLVAGNNLKVETDAPKGLMLAAGNTLDLAAQSEYGFATGNIINYTGSTARDLFLAGNTITLKKDAQIGRDVYAASDSLIVEADLAGDLSATAASVELRDVKIAGNVNLDAESVKFTGDVEIKGKLVYNENAEVSGLDQVTYGSIEAYEVTELDPAAKIVAEVYRKILSIAALFIIMALICAVYTKAHTKVAAEVGVNRFGFNLAMGFGVLVLVPIVAFFAFMSFVLAPLGIVALALYAVMVYLSQGFAGMWLGHIVMEKVFKARGNVYAEAFIGIFILGLLSLVPYAGEITGFIGLLLGLGLIVQCIKPAKEKRQPKIAAKFDDTKAK